MSSKNDLFRTINARSPGIVEQLITGWGSLQFSEYVNDLLKDAQRSAKPQLKEDVISALAALRRRGLPGQPGQPVARGPGLEWNLGL